MRGKGSNGKPAKDHRGITPARAGKRLMALNETIKQAGSPPRVRGKVLHPPIRPYRFGITPARAGKSFVIDFLGNIIRDHPRACGEKAALAVIQPAIQGSPPRVRGKAIKTVAQSAIGGITPARAGKSRPCRSIRRYIRDHPRACGEQAFPNLLVWIFAGSPPRVRGKDKLSATLQKAFRITPARAGKRVHRGV